MNNELPDGVCAADLKASVTISMQDGEAYLVTDQPIKAETDGGSCSCNHCSSGE